VAIAAALSKRANLYKQYAQRTVLQAYISIQHRNACIAGTHTSENIASIRFACYAGRRGVCVFVICL